MSEVRITELCRGGGCGCKMDPRTLAELIGVQPPQHSRLLVGSESRDDACAWLADDGSCLVATADFFTPIVDDPHQFGRIAATNALSDVYAMGARPQLALALVGMPTARLDRSVIARILDGGRDACAAAGVPIAGGHSIDSAEPIYGLAVVGGCRREHLLRNCTARPGDALVIGKPIGVGVLAAAGQQGMLDAVANEQLLAACTQLNEVGAQLAEAGLASALTDVTGFGLIGHLHEMCAGSRLGARVLLSDIPLLPQARQLAAAGLATGASGRNWDAFQDRVEIEGSLEDWQRILLSDPQTSGGLLAACHPDRTGDVLAAFAAAGFAQTAVIGQFISDADARIRVAAGDCP